MTILLLHDEINFQTQFADLITIVLAISSMFLKSLASVIIHK